ncbi:hypothetical protein [Streptomyces sp. NRRL S-1813]|uniref:hypothetical protein n=1 Tax=Streptomyces sp. NRRL S-1813 TaxID=1463888 RepID=UPI0004CAF3DF|nr:hypothetical protein [Streptomyces sp. NRRL S-1813]
MAAISLFEAGQGASGRLPEGLCRAEQLGCLVGASGVFEDCGENKGGVIAADAADLPEGYADRVN